MTVLETNVTSLRSNLADALDQVAVGDIVFVKRRGKPDVALVGSDLLEDYIAATNLRIVKKVSAARAEISLGKTSSLEEVFSDVMGVSE
jgi:PHD/YefM family antitoxin component YafN of YafNO toxin-antitoxin module